MSDDFDLLETNSNEKTGKVDVNWGKAIDTMKSKLAQEDDPEVRQKILNATLDDVVGMAEKDRTTLLDAIKDLTDYQDEVGIIFEKFSSLNASEQKVIDDAQKALERAKITGAIAAIALPPQMAVPTVIKTPLSRSTFKILASNRPMDIVRAILIIV